MIARQSRIRDEEMQRFDVFWESISELILKSENK